MKLMRILLIGATLPAMAAQGAVAQGVSDDGSGPSTWRIDTSHSELTFQIRHLVSRVRGSFGEWRGTIVAYPADPTTGSVAVDITTSSIDTNNARRDADLRSDDFFDAEAHPTITFRSSSVERAGDRIRVLGELTMRGITRPVVLEGEYLGSMRDAQGRERIGFEAETTIDRHEFGVSWNRLVEGGNLLGDDVRIVIAVQAVRQE
jgi:polyisoprenoid-binding protein YceI